MSRDIDALTSFTLKHLRDRWWTPAWSAWVNSHLHATAGDRLLHVGCGNGEVDVALALATPSLHVVSLDRVCQRVVHTRDLGRDVGVRLQALAGDLRALPLAEGSMDAIVCLAVLQHLEAPRQAIEDLAALLRPGGRILVLEPDHDSRLWYSSCDEGQRAFEQARVLFGARHRVQFPDAPARLGLHIVSWLREAGLEVLSVEPVPVAETRLGAPAPGVWETRERAIHRLLEETADTDGDALRRLAEAIADYRAAADAQASGFVEVQHALLIATLAQRPPVEGGS